MTRGSGAVVAMVIARRELAHFVGRPVRIVAAVGTPLLLWALMAAGFASAFRSAVVGDASYAAFLLPGAMTLIAMFASIFGSIAVIEERREGWLQSVLVAPVPRWSIAAGKIGGGAAVALVQAALLFVALPFLDLAGGLTGLLVAGVALAVTCVGVTALGLLFAWRSDSAASFHAVMNLVFVPMWLLSGAFFPLRGASSWLAWITAANPLTWCTQAIRGPLQGEPWGSALIGTVVFAAVMSVAAVYVVGRPARA